MNINIKKWIISQSLEHPKRTILVCLIATLVIGIGLKWLIIEDDLMKILPKHAESVQTWDTIKDEFGTSEMMFVAFGKRGESIYSESIFQSLWDVTEAFESIYEVKEILNIKNFNRMDSEDGFLQISDLQPSRVLNEAELNSIQQYLADNPNIANRFVGKNQDFINIIIRPIEDAALDTLSKNIVETANKYLSEYEIHFGGQIYLMGTMPTLIRKDISSLILFGMIIMVIILFFSLRSISAVLLNFTVIFTSLIAMMGFIGWMQKITGSDKFLFSLLNTSMPIVLLTIANSDGVHVITKFFKKMRVQKNVKEAVELTMDSLLLPIFLTSFTTIVAFLTMAFAPLQQLIGYGIAISMGIAWAWLMSSFLLPALITLKKWSLASRAISKIGLVEKIIENVGRIVMKRPKTVLSLGLLIVGLAGYGISKLNIEVNLMTFFKKGSEIRNSIEFLDNEMAGTMDMEVRIEGDMKSPVVLNDMELIQNYLAENPNVSTSISIADVIKLMHKTIMDNDSNYEVIPDSRAKINNLFTLYSMSGDPEDFESLVDYDYETGLITTLMRNVSTREIAKFVNDTEHYIDHNINEDLKITITGMLVVFRDLTNLLIKSSFLSIFASIILIAIVAGLFFKRLAWGLIAVIPLLSAVLLNFGLMGWVGLDFSHITAILSSVIIGVGVDFAVHYISQFIRIYKRRNDLATISDDVIDDVGFPIILDAGSNMAFGALLFSAFIPIQQIGGLMVLAMLATSVGTLTLMASIIELYKKKLIKNIKVED